jgi:cyclophilin family peptidyl-prolyl cis-trans isomerase
MNFLYIYLLFLLLLNTNLIDAVINKCYNESFGNVINPSPEADPVAPDVFTAKFYTNVSDIPIVLLVTREWAPIGVDRFWALMNDRYYENAAFFRVVPNFVVQFGISSSPNETEKWNTSIPDDPVLISNIEWTVAYATAGPDTRTTQIFINYIDNSRLDSSGFAPFAKVISGFQTALNITNPTPNSSNGIYILIFFISYLLNFNIYLLLNIIGCDQDLYMEYGNSWILNTYPNISIITCTSCDIVSTNTNDDSLSIDIFLISFGFILFILTIIFVMYKIYDFTCFGLFGSNNNNNKDESKSLI